MTTEVGSVRAGRSHLPLEQVDDYAARVEAEGERIPALIEIVRARSVYMDASTPTSLRGCQRLPRAAGSLITNRAPPS